MTMTLEEMENKLKSFEKRLEVMEDIEEIKQLQKHYMNAHGFVNAEEEIECYAENGTLDIVGYDEPFCGKAAIADITNHIASIERPKFLENPTKGSFVVHPVITVNGDKANGKWIQYEMEVNPDTHKSERWMLATYDIEYIKENGKWKINYLKWRPQVPKLEFLGKPEQ